MRLTNQVPESAYHNLRTQWEAELLQSETLIAATDRASRQTWEDNVTLLETVSNAHITFKTASAGRRREMLTNLVSNSQILDDKVHLTLRPWFKLILQANLRIESNEADEADRGNWLPVLEAFPLARAA